MSSSAHEHNRRAWNLRAVRGQRFARPAKDEDFINPLKTVDGVGWLGGDIHNKRLLCLAAGGGRQGPIYAAAGADVTVVDISGGMLEIDRQVAADRGLVLKTLETSMDDLSALADDTFDIVIHPVSTCYLPHIAPVFAEVARVMRTGGIYISQHKQPVSLQAGMQPGVGGYPVAEPYYRSGPLPQVAGSRLREEGSLEYLHRWEEIVGDMCRSGFSIEDLIEPSHADADAAPGEFGHRCKYIAPYVRIKARRRQREAKPASRIWTP